MLLHVITFLRNENVFQLVLHLASVNYRREYCGGGRLLSASRSITPGPKACEADCCRQLLTLLACLAGARPPCRRGGAP